jgi:hypothetical protein
MLLLGLALPLAARVLVADWDANPVEMAKGLVGAVVGWPGAAAAAGEQAMTADEALQIAEDTAVSEEARQAARKAREGGR